MTSFGVETPVKRDFGPRPEAPINLTAAAETMTWTEACKIIGVSGSSDGVGLDIRGLTQTHNGLQNDGLVETVYVVISGFGVLHCGENQMECTGGDVLFVPRGCSHRFERLDGDIRIWSISTTSR